MEISIQKDKYFIDTIPQKDYYINIVSTSVIQLNKENIMSIELDGPLYLGSNSLQQQVDRNTTDIAGIKEDITTIESNIGNLESLDTSNKTSIVAAINETLSVLDPTQTADYINNSKGLLSGEVSTNSIILSNVKSYAHSTFDKSKFTKIGSANIADDGVVVISTSGTQNSNYLKALYSLLDLKDKSWNVKVRFYNSNDATNDRYNILKFGTTKSSSICYRKSDKRLDFYYSTGTSEEFVSDKGKNFTMPNDFNYVDASYAYNAQSGEYTFSYVTDNNTNDSYSVTPTTTNKGLYNINTASASDMITIGQGQSGTQYDSIYPIDLKYFSVIVDGALVFSGNQTGIDTVKPDDYTIVGSPIISADGVASGFSLSNYLTKSVTLSRNFDIITKFQYSVPATTATIWRMSSYYRLRISTAGIIQLLVPNNNNDYYETLSYTPTGIANGSWLYIKYTCNTSGVFMYASTNGQNWSKVAENTGLTSSYLIGTKTLQIGNETDGGQYFPNSIDLNAFKIYINGSLVYQPCLKIPYTLSKTGSKVVDSVYRERVEDMNNQYGYAPYFTLSDTNFTLPMGEVYGLIGQRTLRDSYRNGINYWELYSDRTLEQGGTCESGTTVNLLREFADTNYVLTVPYSAKTTTSFTPSATGDWIAKGLGEL